jgi:hypothetical protein
MSRHHLRKLNVDGYCIVIVEQVDFTSGVNANRSWCVGARRPIALLYRHRNKTIALGMDGEPVDPLHFPVAQRLIAEGPRP